MYEPIGDYCPVCGLDQEDDIAKLMGYICYCSGTEYQGDFWKEGIIELRQNWIKSGYAWFEPSKRPPNWNLQEQMKNIPDVFR